MNLSMSAARLSYTPSAEVPQDSEVILAPLHSNFNGIFVLNLFRSFEIQEPIVS